MTTYVVLIPSVESQWAAATDEERAAMYGQHAEFARLLAERGHRMIDGSELAPASTAKTLRGTPDGVVVTDGPYTEAAEHLAGYYAVDSDDLEDLLQVCRVLATAEGAIEVRATIDHSAE